MRQIDDSSNGDINESNTKRDDDFIDIIVIRSDIHLFSSLALNKSLYSIEVFIYRPPTRITKTANKLVN